MIYTAINILAIITSTISFLINTLPELRYLDQDDSSPSSALELTCVAIFTFDYLARYILTRQNRVSFALSLGNLVDFLAILPSYIELCFTGNSTFGGLVVIRVFRLFRIFRLAKIAKYSEQLPVLIQATYKSVGAFVLGIFSITMFLVLWASAIFYAETSYCQFDEEKQLWLYDDGTVTSFQSIPHSLWWTIVSMCTVGYGDNYPITQGGKTLGILVMLSGILVLAFPLTILSGNFMSQWNEFLDLKENMN